MRLKYTLVFLLFLSFTAHSQKLTGIWRGYFSSANGVYRDGIRTEMYKYEIQIEQESNNSVKGVTYSYKNTVFYGKANLQGIFTPQTKSIIIKETGLIELEIGDKSQPCLMTCYLDYSKIGKIEVLQGTFISINVKDKGDCGSGKVYLEKVTSSDFKTEDFLLKKKPGDSSKTARNGKPGTNSENPARPILPSAKQPIAKTPANGKSSVAVAPNKTPVPAVKNTAPANKNSALTQRSTPNSAKTKPGAETNLIPQTRNVAVTPVNPEKKSGPISSNLPKDSIPEKPKELISSKTSIPRVLIERENNLVKTIETDEEFIQIDMYDNGTIDHDSISVFHNNKQVIKNGELSYTPITLKIKLSKEDPRHEVIMVAENLGEIPPNTALMVITAGKKRYEIFLTSTEEKNAKVVLEYKPRQ